MPVREYRAMRAANSPWGVVPAVDRRPRNQDEQVPAAQEQDAAGLYRLG
jgi:hypothetical protein